MSLQDDLMEVSAALPHHLTPPTSLTVLTDVLDLVGLVASQNGFIPNRNFLVLTAPDLTTVQLPNGATLTYTLEISDDVAFASPVALGILVQTGAGSAGAAWSNLRTAIGYDCKRYARVKVVGSATIHDCSGMWVVLEVLRGV
jgi:hypothetical protein